MRNRPPRIATVARDSPFKKSIPMILNICIVFFSFAVFSISVAAPIEWIYDIIQLSFLKDEEWHVIAAVSDPIDIVDSITTPSFFSPDDGGWPEWLYWVIGLLALLVLFFLLWPVMPYIVQAVIWVIMLPFRLISAIVKELRRAIEKNRDKKPRKKRKKRTKRKREKETVKAK